MRTMGMTRKDKELAAIAKLSRWSRPHGQRMVAAYEVRDGEASKQSATNVASSNYWTRSSVEMSVLGVAAHT